MKRFNILISETAQKELYELDKHISENIKASLRNLAENPFMSRSGADIKKLKGSKNPSLFRLRVGEYRAVYAVIGIDVKVTRIIHRNKGYDWLD